MKQLITILISLVLIIGLMGASSQKHDVQAPATVKRSSENCPGYTIIEAGKGIDCNGDTIKLVKVHGFYQVAAAYPATATGNTRYQ